MHPLHDIELPADLRGPLPVVIEIPRGSKVKYEIDKKTGILFVDRVLYSAVQYPANYGFFPRTLAEDGDALDALVLMQEPIVPLSMIRVRVIGGFAMVDEKGRDDKLVTVAVDDPAFADYTDASQLPRHVMVELRRFFEDYKVLENKQSDVNANYATDQALEVLRRSMAAYIEAKPKTNLV